MEDLRPTVGSLTDAGSLTRSRGRRQQAGPPASRRPRVEGYGSANALMSGPAVEKCVKETRYSFPPTE